MPTGSGRKHRGLRLYFADNGPHEVEGLESLHPMKYRAGKDFTGQAGQAYHCQVDIILETYAHHKNRW